jgi:hypothetical protein
MANWPRRGKVPPKQSSPGEKIILPRAATLGGLGVAYAPVAFLKVLLGCVLLAAAAKTFAHKD